MLELPIKAKYGIAAMFDIALHDTSDRPIQLKNISDRCQIPHNYLEQVICELRKAGFVNSFRGVAGGYKLARPASTIFIVDILTVLSGSLNLSKRFCGCPTLSQFWTDKQQAIQSLFKVSLADLIQQKQRAEKTLTYSI